MDKEQFSQIIERTFESIRRLTATKGEEYSRSGDQLANFKRTGLDTSLHPVKVWQVFFNKHLDAIKHYTNRAGTVGSVAHGTSEPIEGRIDDAILYLILLKALIKDVMITFEGPKVDPRFQCDADRNKPLKGISVDYSGTAKKYPQEEDDE